MKVFLIIKKIEKISETTEVYSVLNVQRSK